MTNVIDLTPLSLEALQALRQQIDGLLASKREKTTEQVELSYNQYKGSGKCWIAEIDPATKKIIEFLNAESREKTGTYSGQKVFLVPLVEGKAYQMREAGTKSSDSNVYRIVKNGKLTQL